MTNEADFRIYGPWNDPLHFSEPMTPLAGCLFWSVHDHGLNFAEQKARMPDFEKLVELLLENFEER